MTYDVGNPGLADHPEPIPMVLYCPNCGLQHIDAPENPSIWLETSMDVADPWTNPPHKSHLCAGCGYIWRPADVWTTGVRMIATKGRADSPQLLRSTPAWSNADVSAAEQKPEHHDQKD